MTTGVTTGEFTAVLDASREARGSPKRLFELFVLAIGARSGLAPITEIEIEDRDGAHAHAETGG
jgi:hypothetical protein